MEVVRLRGLAVSPGIGLGEARLSESVVFTSRRETISDNQVPDELKRLHRAFERTKEELQKLKAYIEKQMGKDQAFI
ncbi:MAG TPA: phosphoenolpyruvate-utilizing N-terminal domain-containing protein, partial [Candidatus Saccharicenans sp.]|nr:phosphoenolpyruvate-utilizing N-terminal domain-containing protein [Candidatus Saccharicenans sp.]